MASRVDEEPLLRVLLEALAKRLAMDRGNWTLEVSFSDGHVREWRRHNGPLPAASLAEFESQASSST